MENCSNNPDFKKSYKIDAKNEDDKNENIQSNINLEKDIKSLYILKHIFSFIDYKKKLEIIKYNKELQKKFLLNINNSNDDNKNNCNNNIKIINDNNEEEKEKNSKNKKFCLYCDIFKVFDI